MGTFFVVQHQFHQMHEGCPFLGFASLCCRVLSVLQEHLQAKVPPSVGCDRAGLSILGTAESGETLPSCMTKGAGSHLLPPSGCNPIWASLPAHWYQEKGGWMRGGGSALSPSEVSGSREKRDKHRKASLQLLTGISNCSVMWTV